MIELELGLISVDADGLEGPALATSASKGRGETRFGRGGAMGGGAGGKGEEGGEVTNAALLVSAERERSDRSSRPEVTIALSGRGEAEAEGEELDAVQRAEALARANINRSQEQARRLRRHIRYQRLLRQRQLRAEKQEELLRNHFRFRVQRQQNPIGSLPRPPSGYPTTGQESSSSCATATATSTPTALAPFPPPKATEATPLLVPVPVSVRQPVRGTRASGKTRSPPARRRIITAYGAARLGRDGNNDNVVGLAVSDRPGAVAGPKHRQQRVSVPYMTATLSRDPGPAFASREMLQSNAKFERHRRSALLILPTLVKFFPVSISSPLSIFSLIFF